MRIPIFDGHFDTLQDVCPEGGGEGRPFLIRTDSGHLDLPRAQEAGFGGGLTSVFAMGEGLLTLAEQEDGVSPEKDDLYQVATDQAPGLVYAQRVSEAQMAALHRLEAESEGRVKVARTSGDVRTCLDAGVFAAVIHFEGAEAIDRDLEALPIYHESGLRSVGVVWSRPNAFGYGVPFDFPSSPDTGPGLTEAGKALVRACNQLGILVDVSHLTERGFWDVASISATPLVATHSSAHSLCPSPRNLTDRQLDAIAETSGLVGINFHVSFLHPEGLEDAAATTIADIVRHIEYVAERIGIEHVAFGSDFDGATMPQELGDVTGFPRLLAALQARGFDDARLRSITHENWLRVLDETLRR